MTNPSILQHQAFLKCEGKLLCSLIGGSTLYGLNTKDSDVDHRGLFVSTGKTYLAGFDNIESIVQTGEVDSTYYELFRFLSLLRKSNTQVLEILFAPDDMIQVTSSVFEELRTHRYRLINTEVLKSSLKGYVFSEIRLATGARSGQLGSKRKAAVERYGFSPKNFCQILRLCQVGIEFFKEGRYMVNVKEFNPEFHELLMSIKTCPEDYTCVQLEKMVDEKFKDLEKTMDTSNIRFDFDVDLASEILLDAKYEK